MTPCSPPGWVAAVKDGSACGTCFVVPERGGSQTPPGWAFERGVPRFHGFLPPEGVRGVGDRLRVLPADPAAGRDRDHRRRVGAVAPVAAGLSTRKRFVRTGRG